LTGLQAQIGRWQNAEPHQFVATFAEITREQLSGPGRNKNSRDFSSPVIHTARKSQSINQIDVTSYNICHIKYDDCASVNGSDPDTHTAATDSPQNASPLFYYKWHMETKHKKPKIEAAVIGKRLRKLIDLLDRIPPVRGTEEPWKRAYDFA
jgi:hypothetical protein